MLFYGQENDQAQQKLLDTVSSFEDPANEAVVIDNKKSGL